jgi:hypothetical protein
LNVFIKQFNTLFNHSLSFNETLSNLIIGKSSTWKGNGTKKKRGEEVGRGWKHGKVCQKSIHHVVTFTIMT